MKVCVIVITYNLDSRIFLLQMEAIKKFCKDDYVVEIIDNSTDEESAESIRYHAMQQGISYIRTYADSKNGSESHIFALNLSYARFKDNGYDIIAYFDHDVIPVAPFSLVLILGDDNLLGGMGQGKNGKTYFWPGMFFLSNKKVDNNLIDFSASEGLDSGGSLYKAIDQYGKDKCIFFDETYHQNPYFNGKLYNHYVMINKGMFLHCINASNWNTIDDNEARVSSLVNIIRGKIDSYVG